MVIVICGTGLKLMLVLFSLIKKWGRFMEKKSSQLIFRIVFICLMILLAFRLMGCKSNSIPDDPFYRLYDPLQVVSVSSENESNKIDSSLLTFSSNNCPLPVLMRVLTNKFDIGIVTSESLSSRLVTVEFRNNTLSDCLHSLSRYLGTQLSKVGSVYFLGDLRSEDKSILVQKVRGYSNKDLNDAVKNSLSEQGKCSVIGAGIVTVTDTSTCIRRISELLNYLNSSDLPVWILQLAFITINREILIEGGLKVSTSGTVSYNVTDNEFKLKDFNIDGLINSAMSSSFADVHSCPMILCLEGVSSSWKYGKRVPVPKKTVSNYGVVSTTDFTYVDVGFVLEARITSGRSGGLLELSIGKSDIEGYVDFAPVTHQNELKTTVDLVPGRAYLLGELTSFKDLNSQSDILNLGKTRGKGSVQVWGQLYRISPGVRRALPFNSRGGAVGGQRPSEDSEAKQ